MIARAQQVGLRGLVLAGVDRDTWGRQDAIASSVWSPDFSDRVAYRSPSQLIPFAFPFCAGRTAPRRCTVRRAEWLEIDGNLIGKPDAIGELGLDAASGSDTAKHDVTDPCVSAAASPWRVIWICRLRCTSRKTMPKSQIPGNKTEFRAQVVWCIPIPALPESVENICAAWTLHFVCWWGDARTCAQAVGFACGGS